MRSWFNSLKFVTCSSAAVLWKNQQLIDWKRKETTMKFSDHLATHITPEWRKQYICYEVSHLRCPEIICESLVTQKFNSQSCSDNRELVASPSMSHKSLKCSAHEHFLSHHLPCLICTLRQKKIKNKFNSLVCVSRDSHRFS